MAKRAGLFVVALGLVAVLWETYKALGPADGGDVFGWRIIPKTNDRVMPHVWEMLVEFGEPEVRGRDTPVWQAMLGYGWYTLRMSVAGLLLGTTLGMGLAILMARFRIVERGLLPYVVASQTIPLIALAPQVAALGGNSVCRVLRSDRPGLLRGSVPGRRDQRRCCGDRAAVRTRERQLRLRHCLGAQGAADA